MVKQWYYETPCGISLLNFKEFVLKTLEIVRRCELGRSVGLQDELEEVSDGFREEVWGSLTWMAWWISDCCRVGKKLVSTIEVNDQGLRFSRLADVWLQF